MRHDRPGFDPTGRLAADRTELDLEALARSFRTVFPHMGRRTAPLAIALYRLLARGRPVTWAELARAAAVPEAEVRATVSPWPGLYEGPEGLTGFGGLSVLPVSDHRLEVDGQTLHTRCAWDTLFLPALLERTVTVHSRCGHTGAPLRLVVEPGRVREMEPGDLRLSMLPPRAEMAADLTALF